MRVTLAGRTVIITWGALDVMLRYRQTKRHDPEAGGILLGEVSATGDIVAVTRVSVPGPYDRATRTSFQRDQRWAQGISEYEFVNSSGRIVYLGEWHTHPASTALPSPRDRGMIQEQFTENLLVTDFLLLVIVALGEAYVGVYDGSAVHHIICPLQPA